MGHPDDASVYDFDNVPEFFTDQLLRYEFIANSSVVRLYLGKSKGGRMVAEYTVLIPIPALATMCQQGMRIAAEGTIMNQRRDILEQYAH